MTTQLKTMLLLAALTGLMLFLGGMLGGNTGIVIALILALAMNFASYWYSDRIVLSMYKARELSPAEAPQLHAIVGRLAKSAGLPKPRVFLVPQQQPNAFATGRNPEHAVVAVTEGIVRLLSPEELEGVLAHEMGHVANRDILIQSVAAVLGSAIMVVANIMQWTAFFGGRDDEDSNPLALLAMAILAPVAASLIQMAISRSREYLADATGARLCGHPRHLASALGKLESTARRVPLKGSPSTENMFIVNPFSAVRAAQWFSTHPPTQDRIERLLAMSEGR